MTERDAMRRAVALAMRGWGRVAPNPLVGAVLLRDGALISEGWHAEFGGPHAEAAALAAVEPDVARGSTCVVTLEPCAHRGKTPPCADALVAAGVARVVVGVPDPTPAAGGGIERLRAAGIDVEVGVEAESAAAAAAGFLWAATRPDRPFVALKLATSLDGFIADAAGRSQWISGDDARAHVQWLRAGFDALAVGRGTVEADDPALTVRGALTPRVAPRRVLFAGRGAVRREWRMLTPRSGGEGAALVLVHGDAAAAARRTLEGTEVAVVPANDLDEGLRALRSAGVTSVLVEGGGVLAGALLESDLVDRLYWVQAPIWLGRGRPAFGDARRAVALGDACAWTVTERRALGRDTLLVVDRELCLPAS